MIAMRFGSGQRLHGEYPAPYHPATRADGQPDIKGLGSPGPAAPLIRFFLTPAVSSWAANRRPGL